MNPKLPIFKSIVVSIITILSALPISASELNAGNSCQFSCVIWEELSVGKLFYRDGATLLPLDLPRGRRSDLYELKNASTLEVHVQIEDPDGTLKYELAGLAPTVSGADRMLFFIEEVEDTHGLPLQVVGIDDSLEVFPRGAFRFFNKTSEPLLIEMAEVSTTIPAGSNLVINSGVETSGGFLPVSIKDENGVVLSGTRFFSQANVRKIVFLNTPNKKGGRLAMDFLSEFLPPPEQIESAE